MNNVVQPPDFGPLILAAPLDLFGGFALAASSAKLHEVAVPEGEEQEDDRLFMQATFTGFWQHTHLPTQARGQSGSHSREVLGGSAPEARTSMSDGGSHSKATL